MIGLHYLFKNLNYGVLHFTSFTRLEVQKCMFHDVDIMNTILLIYIKLTTNVTFTCFQRSLLAHHFCLLQCDCGQYTSLFRFSKHKSSPSFQDVLPRHRAVEKQILFYLANQILRRRLTYDVLKFTCFFSTRVLSNSLFISFNFYFCSKHKIFVNT